jgi:hypothetical protein
MVKADPLLSFLSLISPHLARTAHQTSSDWSKQPPDTVSRHLQSTITPCCRLQAPHLSRKERTTERRSGVPERRERKGREREGDRGAPRVSLPIPSRSFRSYFAFSFRPPFLTSTADAPTRTTFHLFLLLLSTPPPSHSLDCPHHAVCRLARVFETLPSLLHRPRRRQSSLL